MDSLSITPADFVAGVVQFVARQRARENGASEGKMGERELELALQQMDTDGAPVFNRGLGHIKGGDSEVEAGGTDWQ